MIAEVPGNFTGVELGIGAVGCFAQRAPVAEQRVDRPPGRLVRAPAREPLRVPLERTGRYPCSRAFSASMTGSGVIR
jgi:hypothetical protein